MIFDTSNVRAHFRVYFCCTNWFYLKSGVHNHPARVKFHPLFEPAKLDVELIKVLSAKRMSSAFFLINSAIYLILSIASIFSQFLGVGGAASR